VQRKVHCRPVQVGDQAKLRAIWERQKQRLGPNPGEFPDPSDPQQFATVVFEDPVTGKVVGAGCARVVCEGGLVLDPEWATPRDRLRAVMDGLAVILHPVKAAGFTRMVARINPPRWADRLVKKLGWSLVSEPVVEFNLGLGSKYPWG
jgi:hypothetical protein